MASTDENAAPSTMNLEDAPLASLKSTFNVSEFAETNANESNEISSKPLAAASLIPSL